MSTFDAIVVGVGGMGSAALCHLARRGARVLGLEQFAVPHERGSSHGGSRVVREAYYEHPDYVPLLRRCRAHWTELEQASGLRLVHRVGALYAAAADHPLLAGALHSARTHGIPHEVLDGSALARRFAGFAFPEGHVGLFEPGAGFVRPEAAVQAHVAAALRAGARIETGTTVRAFSDRGGMVEVVTDRATFAARAVVLCPGAWAGRLLPRLGVPLRVTRQVVAWIEPRDRDAARAPAMPVWIAHDQEGLVYGIPEADGQPPPLGWKVALHELGAEVDPDGVDRTVRPAELARLETVVRRLVPAAAGPARAAGVCLYTNSPDGHFVIDRLPGHERVHVACGFSGHGFKFTPVVGELLADLALTGTSSLPAGFLGLRRFRQ